MRGQTRGDVPVKRLSPKRVNMRRCVSEETESQKGGHEAMCQQERWASKGGLIWWSPTSIRERNECQ